MMVNGQYWLGLRNLASAIGLDEKVVRFRVDNERNTLVIEVSDPVLREVSDFCSAPVVGTIKVRPYEVDGDYNPEIRVWEFVVERTPANGLMPIESLLPQGETHQPWEFDPKRPLRPLSDRNGNYE